ncbi:RCC1 domain-containing protein [Legionella bononiensis]|uniref:UVB-resistance protein UVR8 n=1 Tax=Legionella bononiensis TaxID=2793102 RepID=A0ABS1WAE1_9GAMM|nr:hypothetical protein [Legionella bononiensis]MBL7480435.1 hypothetical protein [Legionella bononiensis]MBL7526331.1 hypothetical protein [Legionella bononiensis]MBL7563175.1 hypothetical protein [Legionella bononiensis]
MFSKELNEHCSSKVLHSVSLPKDIWLEIALNCTSPRDCYNVLVLSKLTAELLKDETFHSELNKRKLSSLQVFCGGDATFLLTLVQGRSLLLGTGKNEYYQLGSRHNRNQKHYIPITLPDEMVRVESVRASHFLSVICGRDKDNHPMVIGYGTNIQGQLDTSNSFNTTQFTPIKLPEHIATFDDLVIGSLHSILYGRTKENQLSVAVCGYNEYGQLGTGDTDRRSYFTPITVPTEMICIDKICAGGYHSLISGRDKHNQLMVAVCGANGHGQLGTEDELNRNQFTLIQLPEGIKKIVDIQAGIRHSVILGLNQYNRPIVLTCGANNLGQLGTGNLLNTNRFTPISLPEGMQTVKNIEAGGFHTIICGWNQNNQPMVALCGYNEFGQLGTGDNINQSKLTVINLPPEMVTVDDVVAGERHSIIIGRTRTNQPVLAASGRNINGQLGIGDFKDRNQFCIIGKFWYLRAQDSNLLTFFSQPKQNDEQSQSSCFSLSGR